MAAEVGEEMTIRQVQDFIERKEQIEEEIKELQSVLETVSNIADVSSSQSLSSKVSCDKFILIYLFLIILKS